MFLTKKPLLFMLIVACTVLCTRQNASAQDDPRDDADWEKAQAAKGQEALALYRELSRRYDKSPLPYFEMGEIEYEEKNYENALGAYEQAEVRGFDAQTLRVRKAKTLAKLKRYLEAEKQYRDALKKDEGSVAAQFGLASALYSQGKSAEAQPYFEQLSKRQDEWGAYAKEFLASCLYDTGKYDRAILLLEELLQASPKDAALRWTYAKSLYKAKRYPAALEQCRRVADEGGTNTEAAKFYTAACLEALGRNSEAEKAYKELSSGSSDWAREARKSGRALAGNPYRAYMDYTNGYDTKIIQAGDNNVVTGGKDFYTQVFAMGEGRVLRKDRLQIWLGAEHYSINYFELKDNDYFQDAATATFVLQKAGPFADLRLRYSLMFAQLDYQPYERQHQADLSAGYQKGPNRLRFGVAYEDDRYFRDAAGLSGPYERFYVDFKRRLPLWDHELRLRADVAWRESDAPASKRLTQRVRLMYTAQLTKKLSGQVEVAYRRDDFPDSRTPASRLRIDHRLSGEFRLEYQVWKHATLQAGYLYESQDSTRVDQEYGRHQMDVGFTLSF